MRVLYEPRHHRLGTTACSAKSFVLSRWSERGVRATACRHPPASKWRSAKTPPPPSEQVAVSETTPAPEASVAARHELSALQELVARNTRTLMALINDGKDRRMARAAREAAVRVDSIETATQNV